MARLESKVDLGHIPTPDVVVDRLREILNLPDRVSALDPCCGTGAALERLLGGKGRSYGIELDAARATAAGKRLTRALCCAAQDARLSNGAFGMVLLNPPYDDSLGGRLELVFVERTVNWLRPGGVMVLIIKRNMYRGALANTVSRYFEDVRHWRFPDPYFDGPELAFGQSVLVARKRFVPGANNELFKRLMDEELQPLFPDSPYEVPEGVTPSIFITGHLSPDAALDLLQRSPVRRTPPARARLGGRPPLPLRKGHIALQLASGVVDGVYASRGKMPTHVAKGTVRPSRRDDVKLSYSADGKPIATLTETDGFEIIIRAATRDGTLHDIATPTPPPEDAQIDVEAKEDAE